MHTPTRQYPTNLQGSQQVDAASLLFEIVYGVAFLCSFVPQHLSTTAWGGELLLDNPSLFMNALYTTTALLCLKILLERHTWQEYLVTIVTATLAWICARTSGGTTGMLVFVGVLMVLAAKGIDLKRLCTLTALALCLLVVATITLHLRGRSEGVVGQRRDTGRLRPSLGFRNPNNLGFVAFEICLLLAFVWWRSHPWWHLAASAVLFYLVVVADSRTALVSMVICVVVMQVGSHTSRRVAQAPAFQTFLAGCCLLLVGGCIAASLLAMAFYTPQSHLLGRLNYLLSERLVIIHDFFVTYPPTPFGRTISALPPITYSNGWVRDVGTDVAYVRILLHHGVVYTSLFLGCLVAVYVRAVRECHINAALLLLAICAPYALMESYPFMVASNPLLVVLCVVPLGESIRSLDLPAERWHHKQWTPNAAPLSAEAGQGDARPALSNAPTSRPASVSAERTAAKR